MRLFHLVTPQAWAAADAAGTYRPASLADEGFVHFSFAEQVEGTANLLYADVPQLIVIEVDPERLGGREVVVEDTAGTGRAFPHVYGAIPVAAVVARHPIVRADGRWTFNSGV